MTTQPYGAEVPEGLADAAEFMTSATYAYLLEAHRASADLVATHAGFGRFQIGRASCRERV